MAKSKQGVKANNMQQMLRVKFVNIESPGLDLSFNYHGQDYGPLEDGGEYTLPGEVVEHLNSLATTRLEYRVDETSGQRKSVATGKNQRFALNPVAGAQAPLSAA